jgi:cytosine deaminase
MLDLLVHNATLPDGRTHMSVAVQDGRIVEVAEGLQAPAAETVDAGGQLLSPPFAEVTPGLAAPAHETLDAHGLLLTPPFVDAHFHMDATLSYGMPRVNASGTLLEGIALWGELKPSLTMDAIIERALTYCDWAVARGLLAIRSHVDTSDPSLLAVQALLEVKKRVAPYIDLQLVAFPQDGVLRTQGGLDSLTRALDLGVDVVGGIPHFERTMADGATSVKLLCELAAERGLPVDMHGRVTGSHLTSMHSMDNYYVSKLMGLMVEAQVHVASNPCVNITLQGRFDTYPKRRGLTRVPELLAAGLTVAFGQDDMMDPWYALGSADMLEVASMGLHVAHMTSQSAMRQCYEAITTNPAKILNLQGYGLAKGCHADFVLLQARDPVEALRLKATRLKVFKRGKLLAQTPAATASLHLPGRPHATSWMK